MFKKFKEKRALKKKKPIIEMLAKQETLLNELEKEFNAIEALDNEAEKILGLKAFISNVATAKRSISSQQTSYRDDRENIAGWKGVGVGTTVLIAAAATPAVIFAPALVLPAVMGGGVIGMMAGGIAGETIGAKNVQNLINQESYLSYAGNILASFKSRAQEALDALENNCDLDTLAKSPRFKEAFDRSFRLRDRFAEAAINKAQQVPEESPEREKAKPAKPREPRSYIGPVLKKK